MVRSPCCDKEHISRGAWNKEEDELLSNHIKKHGISNWRTLPKAAGLSRCGKSCRLRWINYLRPDLKRGNFTEDEDELIIYLHSLIGNKWSIIAARLQGRTDNEIKNHWNTHIRRKLLYRGIDPKTHKPLRSNANPNPHQRFSSELEYTKMMMMNNNLSSSSDNRVLSEETAAASSAGSQSPINLELSLSMPFHQNIEVKREKTQDHKGLLLGSSSSSSATHDQEAAKSSPSCPCNNLALHMNVRGKCDCAPATKVSVVDALQRFSLFYR